jgi:hypothetical protein
MMHFGMMEMVFVLLSGGGMGNDLLDYLPTDAYWKAKGVTVSVERLVAELSPAEPVDTAALIRDLGADKHETREAAMQKLRALGPVALPALKKAAEADDPEVKTRARELLEGLAGGTQAMAVRRLMAIRSLGELKKPEALPALRALLEAKEPFAADYARQAIAAIEGKPYERPQATKEMMGRDLCLLPAKCGAVAQMRMPGGQNMTFDKLLQSAATMLPPGQDAGKMLDELTQGICAVAERVGNIRLDAITLGVADDVGNKTGFVVVVARGLYDAQAVKAAFAQQNIASSKVEGVEVFSAVRMWLIPCSNDRFIFAAGPSQEQLPVKDLVAALQANPEKPAFGAKMADLIKATDTSAMGWAAVVIGDTYRQASFLAPFETIAATTKKADDGGQGLTLVAVGKDAEAIKQAVAEVEKGIKEGSAELKQEAGRMAFMKPIADFMDSIRIENAGVKVTLTATMKGGTPMLVMPAMLFLGPRGKEVRVAPAVAPAPQ